VIHKTYSSRAGTNGNTTATVFLQIYSLIDDPNPDDPLVPEIAYVFKSNRKEYDRKAREWTKEHASVQNTEEEGTSSSALADNAAPVESFDDMIQRTIRRVQDYLEGE
jgi:Ubiquitin-conjugating enzyme